MSKWKTVSGDNNHRRRSYKGWSITLKEDTDGVWDIDLAVDYGDVFSKQLYSESLLVLHAQFSPLKDAKKAAKAFAKKFPLVLKKDTA